MGSPFPRAAGAAGLALGLVVLSAAASAHSPARLGSPRPAQGQNPASGYGHVATWDVPGVLLEPLDIALGPGGRVFVADGRRNAVQVYDVDGNLIARWQLQGAVAFCDPLVPFAVTVDVARGRVYSGWHCYEGHSLRLSPFYLDSRSLDGTDPSTVVRVRAVGSADIDLDRATGSLVVAGSRTVSVVSPATGAVTAVHDLPAGFGQVARLAVSRDVIHLARPSSAEVARMRLDGSFLPPLALPGKRPVGIGAGPDGRIAVLVESAEAPDRGTPPAADDALVVVFQGERAQDFITAAEVGTRIPANTTWPWSADLDADRIAFTSANSRFEAHWLPLPDRSPHRHVAGGPVQALFSPRAWGPRDGAEAFAVSASRDGGAVVLDSLDELIVAFDNAGDATIVGAAPAGAIDLAVDGSGAAFVTSDNDRVMRLAAGGVPGWNVECRCDLGGRLADGDSALYVTRPRSKSIGVLDPSSGNGLAELTQDETVGLWPSDVAATGARILAAHLAASRIHHWDAAGNVTEWEAGMLTGPQRLGLGPDGTVAVMTADGWLEIHEETGRLAERFVPTLDDGSAIQADDVDVGPFGRVFVADPLNRAVHVFDPGVAGASTPEPSPTAPFAPPPSDGACRVETSKGVTPLRAVEGSPVTVTLGISTSCPGGAPSGYDVVLAIDASASMAGVRLKAAQAAARAFVERLDVRHHRVGLVSFNEDATVVTPVTRDVAAVIDGIRGLRAIGRTNLAAALERSGGALRADQRPGAVGVIILLSDGNHAGGIREPRDVAADERARGTVIFTIGLTPADAELLRLLASNADHYYHAPSPEMLLGVYGRILARLSVVTPGGLVVAEEPALPADWSSADPAAVTGPPSFIWRSIELPENMWVLRYRSRAEGVGSVAVSHRSEAAYTDSDGARRVATFPAAFVEVVTATPPGPAASPTPRSARAYLPTLVSASCIRRTSADIALVLDASTSMGERLPSGLTKLDAARAAFTAFANSRGPGDRLALVTFGDDARLAHGLADPPNGFIPALGRVVLEEQSRLDVGLALARTELGGDTGRARTLVVLSDGRVSPGSPSEAIAQAESARADGITVYVTALGSSVDLVTLRRVASAGQFYWSEDQPDLLEAYGTVSGAVGCGSG